MAFEPERRYDITVNDEWVGEGDYSEVIDAIVKANPGDKIEIEVI